MTTPVWIVVCTQPPTLSGTTVGAMCPIARRQAVETTVEFFQQAAPTSTDPVALDAGTVFAVFSASFSVALLFFLVARGVGSVLRLIRFG